MPVSRLVVDVLVSDAAASGGGGTGGGGTGGGGTGGGGSSGGVPLAGPQYPALPAAATTPAALQAGLEAIAADARYNPDGVVAFTLRRFWQRGVGQTVASGRCTQWNEALVGAAGDRFVIHAASDPAGATVDASGNITSKGLYRPAGTGAATQAAGKRLTWGLVTSAASAGRALMLGDGDPSGTDHAGVALGAYNGTLGLFSGGGYALGVTGPVVAAGTMRSAWFSASPKSHVWWHGVGREWVHLPHVYNTDDRSAAENGVGGRMSNYIDFVYAVLLPEGGADRPVYLNRAGSSGLTFDGTETIGAVWQGEGTLLAAQNAYLNQYLETYCGAAVVSAPLAIAWGDSLFDQRNDGRNVTDLMAPSMHAAVDVLNGGVSGIGYIEMAALFPEREGRADYAQRSRVAITSGEYINQKPTTVADVDGIVAWLRRYTHDLGPTVRLGAWMCLADHHMGSVVSPVSGYANMGRYLRARLFAEIGVTVHGVDSLTDNPDMGDAARAAWEAANGSGTVDPARWTDTTHPNATGYTYCAYDHAAELDSYLPLAGTTAVFVRDRGAFKFLLESA